MQKTFIPLPKQNCKEIKDASATLKQIHDYHNCQLLLFICK